MTDTEHSARWVLRLYVNGASPNSVAAVENIRRICADRAPGEIDLEVVDVQAQPALVITDSVVVAPTLVKRLPEPLRHLVGDLSDVDRVREALDLGTIAAREGLVGKRGGGDGEDT